MNQESKTAGKAMTPKDGRWIDRLKRAWQYWRLRLMRLPLTPHQIGLGLAAGVFAGFLPILPLQTVLALSLAWLLKGSKLVAVLGTTVTNPLTSVPLHMLFYRIGRALVPFEVVKMSPVMLEPAEMLKAGWELYATLCVGALVLAIPATVLSYFLGRQAASIQQSRKRKRENP